MRHAESGGAPVDPSFAPSPQGPAFSAGEAACAPLTPTPDSSQSNREGAVQFELGGSRSPWHNLGL